MELASVDDFLTWARLHGIDRNPEYPELLAFVPERGDSRFWPTPFDPQELLALLLTALDALDPWQSCWVHKRIGAWTFALPREAGYPVNSHDHAQDVVTRWLGIPEGFTGSVRFEAEDRAGLVTLLMVQNQYGTNPEHDYFIVPEHGKQFLWLDHEDVLWVFFADAERIDPFVQQLAAVGFDLPKEPPSPIAWQHWMGPEPKNVKKRGRRVSRMDGT